MEEVIDLTSTALLCGRKHRPCIQDDSHIDLGFLVADFAEVVDENGDVDTKPVFREVKSTHRLTPSISARSFSLAEMFRTGVVPQVVPTAGGVGKLDAAAYANIVGESLNAKYDNVLAAIKARQEAIKQQRSQSSSVVDSVQPGSDVKS